MVLRQLIAFILVAPFGAAAASSLTEFQNISNRGPTDDSTCSKFGGTSIPVTDNEVKTIIRNAKDVDRRLYYQGYVYVMYGSPSGDAKSLVVPTYNITLCRFRQ